VTIKSLGLSKTIGADIEILERSHKESWDQMVLINAL
jgi:hypothetical protein